MKTEFKFTKEIKAMWLAALKSGKYVQGTDYLRKNSKHCCLGVLCEIHPLMDINEKEDSVIINEKDLLYQPFDNMFTRARREEITMINDSHCDGKYTAVIPIIENLKTID